MSGITFNGIPSNLRLPGVYVELNNELANNASQNHKMLVTGQRLSTGTVAAGALVLVSSPEQAGEYFGRGSMLARMCDVMLQNNTFTELWAIALDDSVNSIRAVGTVTLTGNASHSGTLSLNVGGDIVNVSVAAGDTQNAMAANLGAVVNATPNLMVEASVFDGNTVQLKSKNKGALGNTLTIDLVFRAAVIPTSPNIAITQLNGGINNPNVSTFISAMGDQWFNYIAWPYTGEINITALETELEDRWGPMRQKPARAFISAAGTHSTVSAYGNSRNSHLVTCLPSNNVMQPAFLWAAAYCAASARELSVNPSRHLQGVVLKGLQPPAPSQRWMDSERNVHLFDGLSSYTVNAAGEVALERVITMYQKNDSGLPDDSYLDITLLETQDRVRFEQRKHLSQRFARYSLAENSQDVAPGVAVATPDMIKGELLALYKNMFIPNGWCEDYESYAASLIVEIDPANKTRINFRDVPNYTTPLYTLAGKQQFTK